MRKKAERHEPGKTQLTHNDKGQVFLNLGLDKKDVDYVKIPLRDELVRTDYDLLHYAIFMYDFKSLNSNVGNRFTINIRKKMTLEVVNPRADFGDAINLLSIVKIVQSNLIKGKSSEVTHDIASNSYIISLSERSLLKQLGKSNNEHSQIEMHESLKRLKEITVHLTVLNKDVEASPKDQQELNIPIETKSGKMRYARSFGFINDYEHNNKRGRGAKLEIKINGFFLDMCFTRKESLNVRHLELQKISQAEQGIMLYAGGQKRNYIILSRLQDYFRIIHPAFPVTKIEKRQYPEKIILYKEQVAVFRQGVKDALKRLKERSIIKDYKLHFDKIKDKSTFRGFTIFSGRTVPAINDAVSPKIEIVEIDMPTEELDEDDIPF